MVQVEQLKSVQQAPLVEKANVKAWEAIRFLICLEHVKSFILLNQSMTAFVCNSFDPAAPQRRRPVSNRPLHRPSARGCGRLPILHSRLWQEKVELLN